jgi:hypothetical protein
MKLTAQFLLALCFLANVASAQTYIRNDAGLSGGAGAVSVF